MRAHRTPLKTRLAGAALVLLSGFAFARPWLESIEFTRFMLVETIVLATVSALAWARLLPFGRVAASFVSLAAACAFATYGDLTWWHIPLLWDLAPLAAVALLLGTGVALLIRPVPRSAKNLTGARTLGA